MSQSCGAGLSERQSNRERGAAAGLTGDLDGSVVRRDNGFADGKAQAGAAPEGGA